ncbi:MAG: RuBisCO large subunit C-terminal-like domain-containing protein [Candidatus Omnitrophica bacterium]|nr:RuBisCO large subunit C-terminal-like domain-containing protein [Candidatus Omnitrophota bacterium]MCM8811423.1 RuBisCO large subunit C-terminal-like domain-containing protein [Candidatus Omnitrophota bacterium]
MEKILNNFYLPKELREKRLSKIVELNSNYSKEESIEIVYYLKSEGDIVEVAKKLAIDETTGKWIGKGKPTKLFKKCVADVDKIYIFDKGEGIVFIRTPIINLSEEKDFLYQILMLACGGPVLEFVYYSKVSLIDINLPEKILKKFRGPRFGIEGIRKLTETPFPYPIVGTIIKPCAGLTEKQVAEKCYLSAKGGVKFIKDDEKMLGPSYCQPKKKIKLVSEALKKAYEETGNKCIYAPHLVERADKIKDTAKRYIEYGATGLMVNAVIGHNFEVLKILREDPDINVPLYAHSGGRSALSTGERRIEDGVIVKLIRLCGGDFFQHGVFGVKDTHIASLDENLLNHLIYVMRKKLNGIKDTIPVAAGGLRIENVKLNIEKHFDKKLGYHVALLAGSYLLGHKKGPYQGAKIFIETLKDIINSNEEK